MTDRQWPDGVARALEALSSESAAGELAVLWFDFVVGQPVSRFIEPARVLAHVDRALSERMTERVLQEHVKRLLEREAVRARRRDDDVRDWLTEPAIDVLRELAGRPVNLDPKFLAGVVEQDAVRQLVRRLVEDTMKQFVDGLRTGGGGGLFGSMGRGAMGLAGKGPFKKIFDQIEAQLQRAAGSFATSSLEWTVKRVAEILATPEMAKSLGAMLRTGFDESLALKTGIVWRALLQLPIDDLLAVVPGVVAHNAARPEVRDGLLGEVEAWLAIEGERPLVAFLDEAGATDRWRDEIREVGGPLLAEFAASDAFTAWLAGKLS